MTSSDPIIITQVPPEESQLFNELIKDLRSQYIKKPSEVVEKTFTSNPHLRNKIVKGHDVSNVIEKVRELGWHEFLQEEADFNAAVLREIGKKLDTPKSILANIEKKYPSTGDKLPDICGEYAGRIAPYIYALSLSNTQSRRSRAGSTFEAIIYTIYNYLGYPFDSQKKVGRQIFESVGLGKKVDSVLQSIEFFQGRRDKSIIGTMKTSLRERWQEVAEEIERTKIPVIHLLTVDTDIAASKASEMAKHNIVVVTLKKAAESETLSGLKNIISFEDYLFEEIPEKMSHWSN